MPGEIHELTLSTLTYGGEALGHLDDGRAVFVPFALPGERVRVQLVEHRERFARGEVIEILEAAPERIAPRCRHFGTCGGCHYQHLAYEKQLVLKSEIVRQQLARIGRIEGAHVQAAVGSPQIWNYRNQAQFHLTPDGELGYVGARRGLIPSRGVVPIKECHLPEAPINAMWPQVKLEGRLGIERLSIRAGSDGDLLVVLESDTPQMPLLEIEAGVSITHRFEAQNLILAGTDHITMRVLERDFRVSAGAFFQVNTPVAEHMVRHVLNSLPAELDTAVDVYCGVGLFSAFLAPRCGRLIGIDSSAAACADYVANLDEFQNVELYEDLVERVLPALDMKPRMMLVDPPRAGLEANVLEAIVRMAPEMLIYVSCDPSTLARDAARLIEAGYGLQGVTPFDLFPHTYHIESISIFRR